MNPDYTMMISKIRSELVESPSQSVATLPSVRPYLQSCFAFVQEEVTVNGSFAPLRRSLLDYRYDVKYVKTIR
jgi:hypothetical protein